MDIDRAIVEGPMRGELARMTEFGSAIAKHDLPLLYKVLFKVGTPAFIIKRLNIVARQYIRESQVSVEVPGDGRAEVTLGGRRFPMYFCTYGVSGWFRAALELSGAKSPTVEHSGLPASRRRRLSLAARLALTTSWRGSCLSSDGRSSPVTTHTTR